MKKGVTESPLSLVISIVIIAFIVSIGYYEINTFLIDQSLQLFRSDVNKVLSTIEYLISSNSIGSFEQITLHLPKNQSLSFNNSSNKLLLDGFYKTEYNTNVDIITNLSLNTEGVYEITLCYDCLVSKEYVVVFR